jgi:hypothetical protein
VPSARGISSAAAFIIDRDISKYRIVSSGGALRRPGGERFTAAVSAGDFPARDKRGSVEPLVDPQQ